MRVAFSPDGKDGLGNPVDAPFTVRPGQRPANWSELVGEVGPRDGDLVITKHQWGAFYGTELDLQLRRRGVGTIVIGGIATNFGVESTARGAGNGTTRWSLPKTPPPPFPPRRTPSP